jgi:hypothetical protein
VKHEYPILKQYGDRWEVEIIWTDLPGYEGRRVITFSGPDRSTKSHRPKIFTSTLTVRSVLDLVREVNSYPSGNTRCEDPAF